MFPLPASSAMDSPSSDIQNVNPNRRATRSALAEIPARLGSLSVRDNGADSPVIAATVTSQTSGLWNLSVNVPSAYLSPSPSPDELVIQQRGRRRAPVTWSPDTDDRKEERGSRTPVKASPSKSTIVLRSTPRKRLLMNEPRELFSSSTPEKSRKLSPNTKRSRVDRPAVHAGPLQAALKGLSHQQLVDLVLLVADHHPSLEQELRESLPTPDLRPLEDRLNELKKNIFKSLPSNRLVSKSDSPAYNRAATHVLSFKKCLMEQGRQLAESQHWESLMDWVLLAWTYVRGTPVWDSQPHNNARRQCFKFLAAQGMQALKRGAWTPDQLDALEDKLSRCSIDSEDMDSCLKQLTVIRKK
ncbi:uncharacterized protein LOC134539864 isoform X2 [Bacillus rossius redtenbacheri]|uniref:uncharacterized protein LOC134539864 isoform X2 n=1 Tax=Bacillus rossius redtenbacheri TaxID=93214 RepID=UPI002FDDDAD5